MPNFHEASQSLTLSRGQLFIRIDGESSWTSLGHVKDVKVNVTATKVEHKNYSKSLIVIDKTVTTEINAKGSFMCDVPHIDNINLFLMGSGGTLLTQTSGSWTSQSFTVVKPDQWQELGKRKVTITSITDDSVTPVALIEGEDYYIDTARGFFLPLSKSTHGISAVGDIFKISGTYAEDKRSLVSAATTPVKRHIWFQGDPNGGHIIDVMGWCDISPNGDLPLIGEDWVGFTFDISFNKHPEYSESPVGLYYYDNGIVT